MELQRSVERPSGYGLFVQWETVENHMVDFAGSADFHEFLKLVGHCFATPPEVEHVRQVVKGFQLRSLPGSAYPAHVDANQARLQFLEERQYIAALELAANDHLSLRVDAMHLKNRLRDIETNCRNRMHL
jgi:hypothetical protein